MVHETAVQARMTTRRRIERGNEGIPIFCIEREYAPVGQPFFGFAQRRFKHEFADGFARGRCRSLQRLLGKFAEPEIKLFSSIDALSSHVLKLYEAPYNVKTNRIMRCKNRLYA